MKTPDNQPTLAARVAALPTLPMKDLWSLWDSYFPRRPSHHNRGYIEGRVAYKMQEEALATQLAIRPQLIRIGEAQSKIKVHHRTNDIQLVPGTVLMREYDNRDHRVTVLADGGFEYEGKRYRSLSAVADRITGAHWFGPLFFGLVKPERRAK